VAELMKEKCMDDVLLFGGGIIPEDDIPGLREHGVERIIFGFNDRTSEAAEAPPSILYIDDSAGERQLQKLDQIRRTRNRAAVERALDDIREAAQSGRNTMPPILDAVRAYATVGEMCDALRRVWGEYEEAAVI